MRCCYNNIFTGEGIIEYGSTTQFTGSHNVKNIDPRYVNKANYDYRLTFESTWCIDQGFDPGYGDGYPLLPTNSYAHRCGYVDRTVSGNAIDIGAFEYGQVLPDPTPVYPEPFVTLTPVPEPSPSPLYYEAESLSVETSSGDTLTYVNDASAYGGQVARYSADAYCMIAPLEVSLPCCITLPIM